MTINLNADCEYGRKKIKQQKLGLCSQMSYLPILASVFVSVEEEH